MITKDGTRITKHPEYACGAAVRIQSGETALTVVRTYTKSKRGYLASFFSNAADGRSRYFQLWIDRGQAKEFLKSMKG